MKIFLIALNIFAISVSLSAQTNSVDLKDGSGVSIGLHNSVTAAYAAIPATITQPYTIELLQIYTGAMETFPLLLGSKSGASSLNTVTIQPAAGVTSIVITAAMPSSATLSIDDADYLIIDGRAGGAGASVLTIANTGTGFNTNTIELVNGATNNIIRYCRIENSTTSSSGRNVALLGTTNSIGNTDNTIEFCTFSGGRYKINSLPGSSGVPNSRTRIYGCEFLDIIFVGIWCQINAGTMYIDSNIITSPAPVGDGPFGMLFDGQADSVFITRNKIIDLNNGTAASDVIGISIRSTSAARMGYSFINNNFIALSSANSSATPVIGIEYDGGNPVTANVFHNTILLSGVLGGGGVPGDLGSTCFLKAADDDSASHYNIRNNIFSNIRTGGSMLLHQSISITDTNGIGDLNENTYNNATGIFAQWSGPTYNNLSQYQSAVGNSRELLTNLDTVEFVSLTDLHLTGVSLGNTAMACTPIVDITHDIDNDVRGGYPYRGADEALPLITDIEKIDFSEKHFSIFPNPVTDKINIRLPDMHSSQVKIGIYALDGKLIDEKICPLKNEIVTLNNEYSKGIYLLKVEGYPQIEKFVVN